MTVINTSPEGSPSGQDALWHIISSDVSSTVDFKYVFDIYVGATHLIRVKKFPDPNNGNGYFNAAPIVRNMFSYEWFEPLGIAYVAEPDADGQMAITYTMQAGEEVAGVTTPNQDSVDIKVYNYAPPLFKRRVVTIADKLNKWLTNRPLIASCDVDENLYMPFYTDADVTLKMDTYDETNTLIANFVGSDQTIANNFAQMNIGTKAMAALSSITFEGVKYYDVYFNELDKVRVYLTCNDKYTNIPLHFVNRWGMWETLRFGLVSRLTMDVERKSFERSDYRITADSVDYFNADKRYNETKINFLNKAMFTYRLTANAMTDAEYEWAAELIYSPHILMEFEGYFYPVTVKSNTFEFSKYINNKLRAFEIDVEINQDRYSHLR